MGQALSLRPTTRGYVPATGLLQQKVALGEFPVMVSVTAGFPVWVKVAVGID